MSDQLPYLQTIGHNFINTSHGNRPPIELPDVLAAEDDGDGS